MEVPCYALKKKEKKRKAEGILLRRVIRFHFKSSELRSRAKICRILRRELSPHLLLFPEFLMLSLNPSLPR